MRGIHFRGTFLKSSSNLTAAVLLVLALAVVITLLSERHYLRWDVTATGEHTLSEKTLQVLETVTEPVHIKAFSREGHPDADEVKRLLGAYHYEAPGITFELIDPERNPAVTRRYNIRSLNTLILEGYERTQTVKMADEEHITNALIRLTKSEERVCYWVTGHGERAFQGSEAEALTALQEDLSDENYRFEELLLMKRDIPGDATVVVLAAPEKPLFPEEVESLRRYLIQGGRLVVFLEPFQDGGLTSFLKDFGIVVAQDIIVDKMSRVMGGDFLLPMVAQYGAHEITQNFKLTCFFEIARSVEVSEETIPHVTPTVLALTSPESWAETDRDALDEGRVGFDASSERKGPLSLAAISELKPPLPEPEGETDGGEEKSEPKDGPGEITGEGKLVVFGDADFASNKYYHTSGNADFITNTMNYLAGRGDLITIQQKHRDVEALMLNREQGMVLFWIPVVVIPLCVVMIGVVVFLRRRSR
jgi:ABC-type uncharacterized transport system involved in gliding motility auxiliary subunit